MGFACPVCGDPQADGEHLANHLAFTAMLHGDDHEAFLERYVPDWEDLRPGELAAELLHHADEVQYDEVFEDTTSDAEGRGPRRPDSGGTESPLEAFDDETLETETQRAIEEARKLFERGGDGGTDDDDGADAADEVD